MFGVNPGKVSMCVSELPPGCQRGEHRTFLSACQDMGLEGKRKV